MANSIQSSPQIRHLLRYRVAINCVQPSQWLLGGFKVNSSLVLYPRLFGLALLHVHVTFKAEMSFFHDWWFSVDFKDLSKVTCVTRYQSSKETIFRDSSSTKASQPRLFLFQFFQSTLFSSSVPISALVSPLSTSKSQRFSLNSFKPNEMFGAQCAFFLVFFSAMILFVSNDHFWTLLNPSPLIPISTISLSKINRISFLSQMSSFETNWPQCVLLIIMRSFIPNVSIWA